MASSLPIPQPSSLTSISVFPPFSSSIRTRVAPASSAFSTSSFTTEAGRSTTSPAAIWSATASGRMDIRRGMDGKVSVSVGFSAAVTSVCG